MITLAQAAVDATQVQSGSAPGGRPPRQLNFSEHWGSSDLLDVNHIVLVLAVLLTAVGLWMLWRRYRTRHLRSHPLAIYRQIAAELGLGVTDRWQLARLARAQSLSTPITLLLSPATLAHHASAQARGLAGDGARRFTAKINRISKLIYGEPLPAAREEPYDDRRGARRRA